MNGRVRRCAPYLFKRFSTPAAAADAASRSALLLEAGVQTARATVAEGSRLVRFDLIEAAPGFEALLRQGEPVLPRMMRSLVALHQAKHLPDLPSYRPMLKIAPRLTPTFHRGLSKLVNEALDELRDLPIAACVIHGDLHANQFLVEDSLACWIIDFDDLAIGDPAADIGNFAAHLATRPETSGGEPLPELRRWLAKTLQAYREVGGSVQIQSADAYGRLALVRRALKLQEKAPGAFADKVLMHLDEVC